VPCAVRCPVPHARGRWTRASIELQARGETYKWGCGRAAPARGARSASGRSCARRRPSAHQPPGESRAATSRGGAPAALHHDACSRRGRIAATRSDRSHHPSRAARRRSSRHLPRRRVQRAAQAVAPDRRSGRRDVPGARNPGIGGSIRASNQPRVQSKGAVLRRPLPRAYLADVARSARRHTRRSPTRASLRLDFARNNAGRHVLERAVVHRLGSAGSDVRDIDLSLATGSEADRVSDRMAPPRRLEEARPPQIGRRARRMTVFLRIVATSMRVDRPPRSASARAVGCDMRDARASLLRADRAAR